MSDPMPLHPTSEFERAETAITAIIAEYQKATIAHGEFNSAHEGYAVILEELDELWQHVKNGVRSPALMQAMRAEAVQVGAMALRFLVDVCGEVS